MMASIQMLWSDWIARLLREPTAFLLVLGLFLIPLSTSGKSIVMVLVLLSVLIEKNERQQVVRLCSNAWCQAAIAVFLLSCLACVWSPASYKEQWIEVSKYSKLLYLPVLVAGFRKVRVRKAALNAFLAAMLITCAVSIAKDYGWSNYHGHTQVFIFRNHIMTSYMMATAAFVAAFFADTAFKQINFKLGLLYVLLWLLFSYQLLFINSGRTGYVVYCVLMMMLLTHCFSGKKALLANIMFLGVLSFCYHQSPVMQERMGQLQQNVASYQNDKNTPIGYRVQFHHYARDLFFRHPWLGNGSGAFRAIYRVENPVPAWGTELLEPHSQYWLVASEWGVLGLMVLAGFFLNLVMAIWRLPTIRPLAFAVLLPFLLASATDSLLLYSGTGYFFLMMMAICLGEQGDTACATKNY